MTIFIVLSGLMVILALGLLAVGPLRKREDHQLDRNAENVVIARDRLRELKADLAEGRIDEAEFAARRDELEAALLEDISEEDTRELQERSVWYGRWALAAFLVTIPWLTAGMYLLWGNPAAMNAAAPVQRAASPHGAGAGVESTASVQELVGRLEERLAQEPDNAEGWSLLARTYMSLERYQDAVQAFERLRGIVGEQPQVLLGLADAIAMTQGGRLSGRPAQLIDRALALEPSSPIGLWLAGMAAEEAGEPERALTLWRRLEPLLSGDPESQQQVRAMIARVSTELGREVPETMATTSAPPRQDSATEQVDTGAALTVDVALDPALAAQASPDDTVFVYARAAEGPPMPLAIVRHRVAELPLSVRLDDSMAMMPAMRLSNFPQVEVIARVSKVGSATPQSGDLVGSRAPVSTSASDKVAILIDEVVP